MGVNTYKELQQSHPCFGGHKNNVGRIHLPVSPGCNIACKFCDRTINDVEERPGVTSKVLKPEESIGILEKALELCPEITVAGIAEPGDTLATDYALNTFRLIKEKFTIFESDIFESVYHVEKSPCYLCARMRRGYLYRYAKELGCNKIALGHHYDDVIETILMGMLYGAQIQTMMPKLHSTNFEGMELIRPLYLIREEDIKAWRDYNDLHFIQCACKFTDTCTTCNNEENRSKRVEIKELISKLKETNPFVEGNIFKSVENVNLDTVVAYKQNGERHHFLDEYDE